jgi:hypothetical protein
MLLLFSPHALMPSHEGPACRNDTYEMKVSDITILGQGTGGRVHAALGSLT